MAPILRKVLGFLTTLLLLSMVVFLLFEIVPGDAAVRVLGIDATPAQLEAWREAFGYNRPLVVRYLSWLWGFMRGDLGVSIQLQQPVGHLLVSRLPITITMTAYAIVMIFLIALPLALLAMHKPGGFLDALLLSLAQVAMAIPPFFIGIIFTLIFGLTLRLFVPGGFVPLETNPAAFFSFLILPALALAIPRAAMLQKMLRASLQEELDKDYVRTAKSHGAKPRYIMFTHVLKNALVSTVTFLGLTVADLITGSIIIEQVFGLPGMGRLLVTAIANRDYPLVSGITMILAIWILLINLLVDVIYHRLDKRMLSV